MEFALKGIATSIKVQSMTAAACGRGGADNTLFQRLHGIKAAGANRGTRNKEGLQ